MLCLPPSPNVAAAHRYIHLLSKVMVALFVGIPLEMVHKWWRLLLLYVAGVLAGSLAASMFDPKVSEPPHLVFLLFFNHTCATYCSFSFLLFIFFCDKSKKGKNQLSMVKYTQHVILCLLL